jgi:hypothetical protein
MKPLLYGLIVGLILGFFLVLVPSVRAHHNPEGKLPLIPNTPAVQQVLREGVLNYCLDSRAANYPGFASQVEEVNAAYTETLGIRWQRVPYGTPLTTGCQVQHDMPDTHGCSGCAAWIYYANWSVKIEYKWQLAFVSWRTTIGHELGHLFGMHEAYDDIAFASHILTKGFWASPWNGPTVMDVGTHVPFPPLGIFGPTLNDVRVMLPWLLPTRSDGGNYREDLSAVFYGAVRQTSAGFQPARWVAVFASNVLDPELRWLGVHGPVGTVAGIYGVGVPELPPCSAVYIGTENALGFTWGRDLQWVGHTSCPGLW